KALWYAAAGEHTARYTVALAGAVMQLLMDLPRKATAGKHAHESWHQLVDLLIASQAELEPWRGRICLEQVDEIVALLTGEDDSPDDDDDSEPVVPEPPDDPHAVAVPAAFREAMAI